MAQTEAAQALETILESEYQDRPIRCVDCNENFIWTAGEQVQRSASIALKQNEDYNRNQSSREAKIWIGTFEGECYHVRKGSGGQENTPTVQTMSSLCSLNWRL